MNQRLAVTLSVALSLACSREQTPAPAPPAAETPRRVSLVDAGRGGSVVSRTAELMLELGAVLMIDGEKTLMWSTPQGNPEQTVVLSLPARSRIDEIGVQVPAHVDSAPQKMSLEWSLDGTAYQPLITFTPGLVEPLQTRSVTPVEARYLRVSTHGKSGLSQVQELEVYGTELEPPNIGALEGTWIVNGKPATFKTIGARTYGVIGESEPIFLDGGSDGRSYRFAWSQGPMVGRALVTTSPDGKHLSAIQWHQEVFHENLGHTWYGERTEAKELTASATAVILGHLRRGDAMPLYGLRFDDLDQLIESESDATLATLQALVTGTAHRRFTLTAYELRGDAAANRARAEKRIATLRAVLQRRRLDISRVAFSTGGLGQVRHEPETAAMHALSNVVELRIEPPAKPAR